MSSLLLWSHNYCLTNTSRNVYFNSEAQKLRTFEHEYIREIHVFMWKNIIPAVVGFRTGTLRSLNAGSGEDKD